MSHYKVDMRDVMFVLFDWLNVGQLCEKEPYKGLELDEETMKMVVEEAFKLADNEVAPLNDDHEFFAQYIDGKVILPEQSV